MHYQHGREAKKFMKIGNKKYWKPELHFSPEHGWINDPNGLVFYRGQYHLFYQYNPYHCNWDSMHWGHAVSDDLINWEEREIALYPDKSYDKDQAGGCFSGSVVVRDEKMYLFYTGSVIKEGKVHQTQCLAVTEDGIHFEKVSQNPLILTPPLEGEEDFRDPKVVWAQGKYRMVCGGTDGKADDPASHGRIYLYSSEDLYHWEYNGIIYEALPGEGAMMECPDLFCLGEQWVITCSPMYREDYRQTFYAVGKADFDQCIFQVEKKGCLDYGPYYYAQQTYFDKNQIPLSISWLGGWPWMPWAKTLPPTDGMGYRGVLSVPRVPFLDSENNLHFKLFPELKEYEKNHIHRTMLSVPVKCEATDGDKTFWEALKQLSGAVHLCFTIDMEDTDSKQLMLVLKEGKNERIEFLINFEEKKFIADCTKGDAFIKETSQVVLLQELSSRLEVELLLDKSIYTFFLQNGRYTYTGTFYPADGNYGLEICSLGNSAKLEQVELGFFA